MAGTRILVHVTHIDDSVRGRQGPCIYFWGITHDRSLYLLMEKYLECLRRQLETRPPPLDINELDQDPDIKDVPCPEENIQSRCESEDEFSDDSD